MEKAIKKAYYYQYAVKLICTAHIPGTSQTSDGLIPGAYETAVIIHNPNEKQIRLRKKLAQQDQITGFKESVLEPDGVERFVCKNTQEFGITFIHGFEGFLIIESSHSLDITAVYTAGSTGGGVSSVAVEQIKERKI